MKTFDIHTLLRIPFQKILEGQTGEKGQDHMEKFFSSLLAPKIPQSIVKICRWAYKDNNDESNYQLLRICYGPGFMLSSVYVLPKDFHSNLMRERLLFLSCYR